MSALVGLAVALVVIFALLALIARYGDAVEHVLDGIFDWFEDHFARGR